MQKFKVQYLGGFATVGHVGHEAFPPERRNFTSIPRKGLPDRNVKPTGNNCVRRFKYKVSKSWGFKVKYSRRQENHQSPGVARELMAHPFPSLLVTPS